MIYQLAFLVAMVDVWNKAKRRNERSNGERLKASIALNSLKIICLSLLYFLLPFIVNNPQHKYVINVE